MSTSQFISNPFIISFCYIASYRWKMQFLAIVHLFLLDKVVAEKKN